MLSVIFKNLSFFPFHLFASPNTGTQWSHFLRDSFIAGCGGVISDYLSLSKQRFKKDLKDVQKVSEYFLKMSDPSMLLHYRYIKEKRYIDLCCEQWKFPRKSYSVGVKKFTLQSMHFCVFYISYFRCRFLHNLSKCVVYFYSRAFLCSFSAVLDDNRFLCIVYNYWRSRTIQSFLRRKVTCDSLDGRLAIARDERIRYCICTHDP